MRVSLVVVLCGFLLTGVLLAQDERKGDESFSEEVRRLIKELGAEEFATRESAMKRLIEIGKPAVEALKEALKSDDPEVVWRARKALEEIGEKSGKTYEPEELPPAPWGKELLPPDEWFEELRKRTEKMRKSMLEELKESFPDLAKETEKIEKRFREAFPPDFNLPAFEGFDELFRRMEEANRRLQKMLEELNKPQKWRRKGAKDGRMRVVIERKSIKKHGERPRTKVNIYVWKNGRLVKKEEKELFEGGEVVGLSLAPVPDVLRYHLRLDESKGVLVEEIDEDSPFYKGGLRKNDIIVQVDGKPVNDRESFMNAISGNEKVKLTVLKGGKRQELDIIFPKNGKKEEK